MKKKLVKKTKLTKKTIVKAIKTGTKIDIPNHRQAYSTTNPGINENDLKCLRNDDFDFTEVIIQGSRKGFSIKAVNRQEGNFEQFEDLEATLKYVKKFFVDSYRQCQTKITLQSESVLD